LRKANRILTFIWAEFVFGGHLLSAAGAAITATALLLLGVKVDILILVISYLLLQVIYNYNHFKELDKDQPGNPERAAHLQRIRRLMPVLILAYAVALLVCSALANIQTLLFVLFLLFGGYLFTMKAKGLTDRAPIFKNIYTALLWAIGAVLLVSFYHSLSPNPAFLLIFLFIFIQLVLNTIYFDIKDTESDRADGLKTLPALIGGRGTLRILHILNAASFLPIAIGVALGRLPLFSLGLLVFFFYGLAYLVKTEKLADNQIRLLSYTIVDGQYALWPVAVILTRAILGHFS